MYSGRVDSSNEKRGFGLGTALASGLCTAVLTLCVTSVGWAFEDVEPEPVGLQGILPEEVPDDLVEEEFLVLEETWREWSAEVAAELRQLYEPEEPLSVAEQRAVLNRLKSRLRSMERAIDDRRYRAIFDPLISLHGRLTRRVELAQAVLDTLEMDPEADRAGELEAARRDVLRALRELESSLHRIRQGAAWLSYVRAAEVRDLLEDAAPPDEATPVLRNVLQRLRQREQLTGSQRDFLERPAFVALERALDRFVAVAERPAGEEYTARLRELLSDLVDAAERTEAVATLGASEDLRAAFFALRRLAPDGGARIEEVLRDYYFNYNMQVLLSEGFLARWFSDEQCEFRPVHDFAMGARISGHQTTRTVVGFDLRPSRDGARFELSLNGTTQASTRGDTRQVTVFTQGHHLFHATKQARFDGEFFTTQPAHVHVNPNNIVLGARTNVDWIPIIGSIARRIAVSEARRRRPQSDAMTASRIIQNVAPEFDREVDESFSEATRELQTNLFRRLREEGLYAARTRIVSSERFMRLSSLVREPGEPAGGIPTAPLRAQEGITAHVHESLLNNAANRWGFAGRTMTEEEVRRELERFFANLLGTEVELEEEEEVEGPNIFVFHETDPVRFQVDGGAVNVIVRAAFRDENGEDIPPQVVTIPLIPRLEGDDIIIERGRIRVAPVDPPEQVAVQIARAGIIRRKLEATFPDQTLERRFTFERDEQPDVVVHATRIKALNGWLTMWAR